MDELKTILTGRSHCPICKEMLSWYEMIPLLSFLLLRGKCRHCGVKISLQYPIVEIVTGILFLILFQFFGLSFALLFYLILFSVLIVIFVYDLQTNQTPEYFAWFALLFALIFGWYFTGLSFSQTLFGGLISGGVLAFLVYGSGERWMGKGDIKIGAIIGLLAGPKGAVLGLFMAFVLGAIISVLFLSLKKKTMKESLPFTPFLIISALITLLYGNYIISWYTGNFFSFY